MFNELAHYQAGGGPLDAINVEYVTGNSVEVLGVSRHNVHEQVSHSSEAVHLNNLGNLGESPRNGAELALLDRRENERFQWKAEKCWIEATFKGPQRLFGGVSRQPGPDCVSS